MKQPIIAKTDGETESAPAIRLTVGANRRAMVWRGEELSWRGLVARLSEPFRLTETIADVARLSKEARTDLKDKGGYLGGVIAGERRLKSAVQWRTIIALDADFATSDFITRVREVLPCRWLIHSTFSHTDKKPRYRLIIAPTRSLKLDEFAFVSRRLAADIGIGYFDKTTHDPNRLMFWPVAASDAPYVCKVNDGAPFDPDEFLSMHPGWQDMSAWAELMDDVDMRNLSSKQADPLKKDNIVGAFCRTYDIKSAIARFLPGVYEEAEAPGRMTFTGGTTAAGAVIYENKFLYSFHSTDPVSERLVNAFDLVRIHRFGGLDDKVKPDTPATRLPSYRAMEELALADDAVKREMSREQSAMLKDFDEKLDTVEVVSPEELRPQLEMTRRGQVMETPDNLKMILTKDENLAGKFAFNDFVYRREVTAPLPWRDVETSPYWTTDDDGALRNYLARHYGITNRGLIQDALSEHRYVAHFHPIRDRFDTLVWDGVERADTLLIDFLGAADTEYVRTVTRKMLLAAVTRIYEPGAKFDYMLVLVGTQGLGKSALLSRLGGKYFSDSVQSMQGKESVEQLQGKFILEFAELAAMRKMEIEQVKNYISKQVDTFRPAYARYSEDYPRQCVFFGSTNNYRFLRDPTGNRRFWPVEVFESPEKRERLFNELNDEYVWQVWAEIVDAYRSGRETLFLTPDMERAAREMQDAFREVNDKQGLILEYLDTPIPHDFADWEIASRQDFFAESVLTRKNGTEQRTRVCVLEVWTECMGQPPERLGRREGNEIRDIMDTLPGWKRYGGNQAGILRFGKFGRQVAYVRC